MHYIDDMKMRGCNCGADNCTVRVGSSCHPRAKLQVRYWKKSESLKITCSVCGRLISEFAVAHAPPETLQ